MFLRWLNNRLIATPDSGSFDVQSDNVFRIYSHFVHSTGDFITSFTGSGASASITSLNVAELDKQGILGLRSGTTTTGISRLGSSTTGSTSSLQLGFHDWIWESMSRNLVLSNSTDRFLIWDGLLDTFNTTPPTDGVYFSYSDNQFNGNWAAVTRSNNIQTIEDTGVPANTNWTKKRITINKAATSAKFFINGTQVREITTNIPTGTGRQTSVGITMFNLLGVSASRGMNIDYVELVGRK